MGDRSGVPTRVLLVDDQPDFVESAEAVLKDDPRIEVVGVAHDGSEAVELVERLQPDLVLMDIQMPGMDGVSATRAIRERSPATHVVMLTGSRERADELGSGEAGAVGYLAKDQLASPRLADELLALVRLS